MPSTRRRSKTPCPDEAQQPEPVADDATAERLQGGKARRGGRRRRKSSSRGHSRRRRSRIATLEKIPQPIEVSPLEIKDVEEDRGDRAHDLEEAVADPAEGPREKADDHESMLPVAGRAGTELEELLEIHAVVIQREDS
ncbi:hypothetical protein OSTOST_25405 [Ostertagia ostertagi]